MLQTIFKNLQHIGKSRAGLDKSRTYVRDVLRIINFINCRTWLFFNKYAYEHAFSVSWVREAAIRN